MRNLFMPFAMLAIFLCSCADQTTASPVAPDVADVLQDAAKINRGENMEQQENLNIINNEPQKIVGLPGAPGFDEKTFGPDAGWIPTSANFFGADIWLMDPRISIIRLADIPSVTLPDESWSIRKPDQLWPRRVNSTALEFGNYIFERDGYSYKINFRLNQFSDNISALRDDGMGIRVSFRGSSRLNTLSAREYAIRIGQPRPVPIAVKYSSYTEHYLDGGVVQRLACIIGNLYCGLKVVEEEHPHYISIESLGEMASRLSALFDPPPDDARDADPDGLVMIVLEQDEDGPRIVVETPEDGPYNGWWLRLDTTAGRISVEAPGRAVIKNMPDEGAIITVYAISPDGEQWHRHSRDIK